ncbi:flagellar biosynthesis anti-sigma factor FlgM [Shouchella sp. 1P09AA]|uniref:flagellar biosynthesis anti-sigma factor FlgM n=1 Tax=unclassified Shouchella TaxID=2893065 RepID=UPI00399F3F1F
MKIHSSHYIGASEPYKNQMKTTNKSEPRNDKVEISKEALELSAQSNKAKEIRLQELKEKIQNGTYELEPEKTAQAILTAWKGAENPK